jgi:hypothetical protein
MTTEDDTFNILKRIPYAEMYALMEDVEKYIPNIPVGTSSLYQTTDEYDYFDYLTRAAELLNSHGWTYADFSREAERKSIIEFVENFNKSIQYPKEFLEHAKKLFPNIKMVVPSIEFE